MNKKVLSISAVLLAVIIVLLIIDSTLDRPIVTNKIIKAIYPDWDPEKKKGLKDEETAQQGQEDLSAQEQGGMDEPPSVDIPTYSESRTPMMQAVMKGDEKKLMELMNSDSSGINKQDLLGFTALNLAVYMGKEQAVKTLLIGGANPNIPDVNGMTPTAHASRQERLNLAKLLLERGANPNKPNNEGQTPLMIAAHYGHEDLAELLLHNNANVNVKDKLGRTALIEASANGYTKIVLSLLSLGADKTARDNVGQTAQDYAFRFGHEDIAEILSGQQAEDGTVVGEPMPEAPVDTQTPAQPLLNQPVPTTPAAPAQTQPMQAQPVPQQQNQQPTQFRSNLQ
ncbi:ankyrin repeat domain-containing protein [Seleniivibrio sp.]|uniref:ankyrin repeat domain-containing protein n=1 Tax=Seleniivibrio sp. TaxID=2898801 RepID=UPI0025D96906|nr:ankyrin repeat domain-containing protein [Seleniivibrio sp.]MCD8553180.1 ankyrin repeat domain-containing protein [Seleniivibrio sp.]